MPFFTAFVPLTTPPILHHSRAATGTACGLKNNSPHMIDWSSQINSFKFSITHIPRVFMRVIFMYENILRWEHLQRQYRFEAFSSNLLGKK
jgi:hypothetical protein